jgi:hypothetical protein
LRVQSVQIDHPFMLLFVYEGFAKDGLKTSTGGFSMALYVSVSTAERIRMKIDTGDYHKNFVGVFQFLLRSGRSADRVHKVVPVLPCEHASVTRYAFLKFC